MSIPQSRFVVAGAAALLLAAVALAPSLSRDAPAQEPGATANASLEQKDWPLSPTEARGRAVYLNYCVGCHGDEGRGDGPASKLLDPLPRDFQSAKFKFRSTGFGELPLDSDLIRTVTCGLPGSSMPGFPLVPEIERRDVVRYVLHLAKFGLAKRLVNSLIADDGETLDQIRKDRLPGIREDMERRAAALRRVTVSPETAANPESVERGRVLFDKCVSCHGARGVGDGTSSYALRDWQNAAILPRDFTTGVFRSGSTPDDVFVRVKTGLTGTPMPGFATVPDAQVWDLVHFILSLKDPHAEKPKMTPGCAHEGDGR